MGCAKRLSSTSEWLSTRRTCLGLALIVGLGISMPLGAHHSFVAFDAESEAFVRGTVSGFEFRNPHTYIYVDIPLEDGQVASYRIESETRNDLYRNGWRDDSLQTGDVITARVHPARDPARRYGRLLGLEKADGAVLEPPNADDERGRSNLVPAESLEGVWLPIQTFRTFFPKVGALINDRGRAEAEALRAAGGLPPNTRCIDMSIPQRLGRAHVYEIEFVSDELILIHGEDDAEARRIYLDGRSHPESVPDEERSYTEHSVGHWEGETLVIDTANFKYQENGHAGYPSSGRKHLIERYTLNEDKTEIRIEFTLEDPEYLTGPLTHTNDWQHSPHITRMPYSCDVESALEYLAED